MAFPDTDGMTLLDAFLRDSRIAARNARTAADTAVAGGAMMQAAGDVIAARLDILAAGMADPLKADISEISLMGAEKLEASAASAASLTQSLGRIGEGLSRTAADELQHAGKAASAMGAASSPAAFAAAQADWVFGFWGRAAAQTLNLNAELLKAQAEALKPIHDTAVANAKRLKK